MNKLQALLRAHINDNERAELTKKNGKDPAVTSSALERLLGVQNSRGGQDDVVAELSPKDAIMLKRQGGSGRVDPQTKDIHFDDSSSSGDGTSGGSTSDSDNGYGGTNGDGNGGYSGDPGAPSDTSFSHNSAFDDNPTDPGTAPASTPSGFNADGTPAGTEDAGLSGGAGAPGGGMAGFNSDTGWSSQGDNGQGDGTTDAAPGTTNSAEYSFNHGSWDYTAPGQQNDAYSWGKGDGPETSVSQLYSQSLAALGLDGARSGIAGQSVNSLAAPSSVTHEAPTDENSMYGEGPSAFSTGTAAQAGNSVSTNNAGPGGRGDTFDAVTNAYADSPFGWDAENNQGGGLTGYANQALEEGKGWISEHPGLTNAINLGLSAVNPVLGGVASALTNTAKGNYGPAVSQLAGLLGGPAVGQGVSLASNVIGGTPGNIVGGVVNNYANSLSPGLGTALGISGITGYGSNAINSGYQSALAAAENDMTAPDGSGSLGSADSVASADAQSDTGAPSSGSFGAPAFAQDTASPSFSSPALSSLVGGGGSNDSGTLGNDFIGSKKKSRYLQNQLMALLGGQNAA